MAMAEIDPQAQGVAPYAEPDRKAALTRAIAWANIALIPVFLANNFLIFVGGWPGVAPALGLSEAEGGLLSVLQLLSYPLAAGGAIWYAYRTPRRALRADANLLSDANAYIIRGCFWSVLFVGVGDTVITFLGNEGITREFLGQDGYVKLRQQDFRAPFVHMPLVVLAFIVASFTRTLGFLWLALMVVVAEFLLVVSSSAIGYEQSFMGDLVRYWYAALFLFASAHTLLENGHVRVDVIYAGLKPSSQGRVNAFGAVVFGMSLCWIVLYFGMSDRRSAINGPMLDFERGPEIDGLFIKYNFAVFLAIFAITMLIQFCAMLLDGVADARDEPGRRQPAEPGVG